MPTVKVRELSQRTSEVLRQAHAAGRVLVTRRGRPYAMIVAVEDDSWEDLVIARDPELRAMIAEARAARERGEGASLEGFRAQLRED